MKRSLTAIALVVALASCRCQPHQPSPPPRSGDVATCPDLCAHARTLGCPSSAPSPAGVTCEDRCAATQRGIAPYDLACRASAASCAAMDGCEAPAP